MPAAAIDFHLLLKLAVFHRVAPLVYEHRQRLKLPEEALEAFRAATLATLHRNLQFAAELKLALRALNAAGIPVILLKGAHLMDAIYANPGLRPMSDLDLLVQPHHAVRATHALRDEGYEVDTHCAAFGLSADREIKLDKHGVHDLTIELHTDLNRPTRHHWFPMDCLWERSQPYPFQGVPARALGLEDNVTFLCAHAVPHAFSQLIWLRDMAGLAGRVTPAIADIAAASRTRRATFAGLWVSASMLGASVADGVLEGVERPEDAGVRSMLSPERLFAGTHYSTVESLRFRAALSDTPADAAAIIGAGALRKAGEFRRGLTRKKQK